MNICVSIIDNCKNLYDSFGEICVKCNCCGRIDEKTKDIALYKINVRQLKEIVNKIENKNFQSNLQQGNIARDIEYYAKKIQEAVKNIDFDKEIDQ